MVVDQLLAIAPLAGADQQAAQIAALEPRQRIDQHQLALPARQASRQHHHLHAVGQLPFARQPDDALGADALGIEAAEIDAALDDPELLRRHAIDLHRMLGDELRDGNDALALGHHRVVAPLDPAVIAIGIVESGDEMAAGAARGAKPAPGRSAAPGMQDVDALAAHELRQALDIAPHGEGVLGGERQLHMQRAGALDLAHHRAAFGRHHRFPAAGRQRRRHLDRAALDAAGDEARQYLQHRRRAGSRRRGGSASLGLLRHERA